MKKTKIGRNEPCPCGSGKKYKRCCGSLSIPTLSLETQKIIKQKQQEIIALQKQRKQQQGLGRPIISTTSDDKRIMFVGNKVYSSTTWKTFHDFLSDYIRQLFGTEWYKNELSKPYEKRHPFLKIYELVCNQQKTLAQTRNINGIFTGNMPGAASFYYWLAYNLYLIGHNNNIQNTLMERLKHPDQFSGACYETFVAAIFLRAGFTIEFEDETNRGSSHCEFVATHKITGKKYGVEVKQRNRKSMISNIGSDSFKLDYNGIGKLLKDALKKDSDYERVIFIDINLPSDILREYSDQKLQEKLLEFIKLKEKQLKSEPHAYVFLTNYPYHHEHDLETTNNYTFVLSDGFKINDYGFIKSNLHQAIKSREKHKPIYDLFKAIESHNSIPSTFDGSMPEFSFGDLASPRLVIGNRYAIPDKNGNEVVGVLEQAGVSGKQAWGIYFIESTSKRMIVSSPLSDIELEIYKKYPDTFFGAYQKVPKEAKTPLDLYYFFYDSFSKLSKEDLLIKIQGPPNSSYLQSLSQNELLSVYCEGLANNNWG